MKRVGLIAKRGLDEASDVLAELAGWLEARGVQLFSSIDGDHFTILGMPLLPLLGALRDRGLLLA